MGRVMDGTYRRLTAATLIAHQRRDDSGCLCGTLRLGESWADHVAEILDLVGALRSSPPRAVHPDHIRPGEGGA